MFTATKPIYSFDSMSVLEGSFSMINNQLEINLKAAYQNKDTLSSHGYFDAKVSLLSEKTLLAFQSFIDSAEEDIGIFNLGGGYQAAIMGRGSMGTAERGEGLRQPRGLGEP
jgi:hypothetical protein